MEPTPDSTPESTDSSPDSTVDALDPTADSTDSTGAADAPDATGSTGAADSAGAADAPDATGATAPEMTCYCPLGGVIDLLSRRYAMQLICVVGAIGPARYGDVEDAFDGASSSTLSTRLDELVEAGYLAREQYAEIPPRVEYELTPSGEELGRRLQPLLEWAKREDERPTK